MSAHALMKRGEATMNVPPAKVPAYEADGWTVIEAAEPVAQIPALRSAQREGSVSVETPAGPAPEPKPKKAKGKGKN